MSNENAILHVKEIQHLKNAPNFVSIPGARSAYKQAEDPARTTSSQSESISKEPGVKSLALSEIELPVCFLPKALGRVLPCGAL